MDNNLIVVFVTVDTQETAKTIADQLLTERKAACVNILPGIESRYWWQGAIESAQELLIIIKTRIDLLDELKKIIKQNHPYSVPEIIALPIIGGNEDYLDWMEQETE